MDQWRGRPSAPAWKCKCRCKNSKPRAVALLRTPTRRQSVIPCSNPGHRTSDSARFRRARRNAYPCSSIHSASPHSEPLRRRPGPARALLRKESSRPAGRQHSAERPHFSKEPETRDGDGDGRRGIAISAYIHPLGYCRFSTWRIAGNLPARPSGRSPRQRSTGATSEHGITRNGRGRRNDDHAEPVGPPSGTAGMDQALSTRDGSKTE